MIRRTFLKAAASLSTASLVSRLSWAAADHKATNIGLQLYTVRFAMAKDFEGSLAKVAAVGYREVELAEFKLVDGQVRYFGKTPKELHAALDGHGLKTPSTHVSFESLSPANFPKVLEASHVLGHQYIINPWIEEVDRKKPDIWKHAAETYNHAGEECKKAGFQFGYHNHWFEFLPVEGKLPYDILLQQCDPNLVKMEMDLCWITAAGADPVKYFEQYPGRFPMVHVKDLKSIPPISTGGAQNFGDTAPLADVGSGIIDWKRIFAHSEQAGIKLYVVEHDRPTAPFDSIKSSYQYLKNLRW